MTLESLLEGIADPEAKLSAIQLASLSDLAEEDSRDLAEAWADIAQDRRLRIVTQLAELAEDNVDLNFDAIYKLALQDEDHAVREAALRGLYEYEGRDLIKPLAGLLRNDEAPGVRREAAIALGRYAVAAELGQLGERDADTVRETLTESAEDVDEDEHIRARAIEAVGAITDEAIENLIESIYQEDNIWLKVGAVDAMGRSCNELWLPTVLREMTNPSPEMRHAAAFAAGEIGEEEAVPMLKRMAIEDPDREVQLAAIHSLGEIGGATARVALQAVLFEGDDSLREAVEEATAEIAFNEDPLRPSGI